MVLKQLLSNYLWVGIFIILVGAGSLVSALIAQYMFGLQPCVLCIYQRWPHGIAALLGFLILAMGYRTPKWASFFAFLGAITFLIGAGIAAFHVGVEQHWWQGTAACSFPKSAASGDFEGFKSALLNAPVTTCDSVPWSLFGISMAGYNFLLSLGSGIVALLGSIFIIRKANRML